MTSASTSTPSVGAQKWTEKDGVIYCSVTSDGTTGYKWIGRLEDQGFYLSGDSRLVLRSDDFRSTNNVQTKIAILKGVLFQNTNHAGKCIHDWATRARLIKSNIEVACLIREKFSDEDIKAMGIEWIVVMHEPYLKNFGKDSDVLLVNAYREGRSLETNPNPSDFIAGIYHFGFAFAMPEDCLAD